MTDTLPYPTLPLCCLSCPEQARAERAAAEKAAAEELALSAGSAEKELGNAAVQKKDMKAALLVTYRHTYIHIHTYTYTALTEMRVYGQHYTRAIQLAIGDKYERGSQYPCTVPPYPPLLMCCVYVCVHAGVSDVSGPLLSLAVSSFNNRSLAHLKLGLFPQAIADASFVADHYRCGADGDGNGSPAPSAVSKEMYVKAIFRRAQARSGLPLMLMLRCRQVGECVLVVWCCVSRLSGTPSAAG